MGSTALKAYLGEDKSSWKQYDATEIAKSYSGPSKKILIDQGTSDNFWKVSVFCWSWTASTTNAHAFSLVGCGPK